MKSLYIPLHSFSGLITNSSSETFISADQASVDAVRGIVDDILKAAGSDKKADDLFTFELGKKSRWSADADKICVTPKETANPEAATDAAKWLSCLDELFCITSEYNG